MSLKTAIRRFSWLGWIRNQSPARYILNIEKAKEKARRLEAKGQLDKAVKHYEKILEDLGGKPELTDELSLFNKLGDLYVKQGNTTGAVDHYEKAIDHYAEQGFPNNAIALCNKVLRNAPGRTHIYLKLAKLMMERGFASEAKQNLLEYAERMQKAGKLEEAFHALKEFADLSPDKEEIRLILADQLKKADRGDEAHEQLAKLYQELQESGDRNRARATLEKMRAIDPEYDLDAATPVAKTPAKKQKSHDIVFLDLDEDVTRPAPPAEPPEEIEPLEVEATSLEGEAEEVVPAGSDSDLAIEPVVPDRIDEGDFAAVAPIDGLDVAETFEGTAEPVESLDIETTALDGALDVPEIEPVTEIPDIEVPSAEDEIEAIGVPEFDAELAAVRDSAALDELPMLDVPFPDEDVEFSDLDEVDTASEVVAKDDLPMVEAPVGVSEDGAAVGESVRDEPDVDIPEFDDEDLGDEIELEMPQAAVDTAPDISALEFAVADDPDAAAPHRELGEALIEVGDRERGMQELGFALDAYESTGDTRNAKGVLDEILRLDPNSVSHHQTRVEFALHEGDERQVVDAFLELADALLRNEELERARYTYERVLEREPGNDRAQIALEALMPEIVEAEPEVPAIDQPTFAEVSTGDVAELEIDVPVVEGLEDVDEVAEVAAEESVEEPPVAEEPLVAAAEPEIEAEPVEATEPEVLEPVGASTDEGRDFVDLGALIMDDEEAVKDTRMRIDRAEPEAEEEQDFAEMLSEFKKGIDANIDADDSQAHYDLGVAFKEMGLMDEAISEFQKALRGKEGRLRTSEALGLCFFEKRQYAIAATVLRRAVESEPGADDEKIGLLYWLGRCEEHQGRNQEALAYYQRIFSIDINFQDISDRVNTLTQTSG